MNGKIVKRNEGTLRSLRRLIMGQNNEPASTEIEQGEQGAYEQFNEQTNHR
jgi:hypothetical protein